MYIIHKARKFYSFAVKMIFYLAKRPYISEITLMWVGFTVIQNYIRLELKFRSMIITFQYIHLTEYME